MSPVALALQDLVGGSADDMVQALCGALELGPTQDDDAVRISLARAVYACEDAFDGFDPDNLSPENVVDLVQQFVVEQVVERALLDALNSMQSAASASRREDEMRDYIAELVDYHSEDLVTAIHAESVDQQHFAGIMDELMLGVMSELDAGEFEEGES